MCKRQDYFSCLIFDKSKFLYLVLVKMKAFLSIYLSVTCLIDIQPKADFTLPPTLPLVAASNQQIILHMFKGLTLIFLFTKGKQLEGQKCAKILLQSEVK